MLQDVIPGLTGRRGDLQRSCASGLMDAAKHTCPGALRAHRRGGALLCLGLASP
jgi:hypothetical protein